MAAMCCWSAGIRLSSRLDAAGTPAVAIKVTMTGASNPCQVRRRDAASGNPRSDQSSEGETTQTPSATFSDWERIKNDPGLAKSAAVAEGWGPGWLGLYTRTQSDAPYSLISAATRERWGEGAGPL